MEERLQKYLANSGKAPKKIKIKDKILDLENGKEIAYRFEHSAGILCFDYYIENKLLDTTLEILDEEDEFIEIKQFSKLVDYCNEAILERVNQLIHNQKILIERLENANKE